MSDASRQSGGGFHGFDLRSVSWGYRRIFADTIEGLLAEGTIGPERARATKVFFDLLKLAKPGSFDFALKEFLGALNSRTKWLLELPGVFEEFCQLGRELAEEKLAHGIAFFRLWGQGAFGSRPEHVTELLRHVRTLRQIDPELTHAFMTAYGRLLEELDAGQINLFVNQICDLHRHNRRTAVDFAALRLKSAGAFVRNLTQEARLAEVSDRLVRLASALGGRAVEVGDLSGLDSDALIDRNSTVVCIQDHLYLPSKIRCCPSRRENEALYLLATVVSATALREGSFVAIQGRPGRGDLAEWLRRDLVRAALVGLVEIVRIVEAVGRNMPGARRLLEFGIQKDFALHPARTATDMLLQRCLRVGESRADRLASGIREAAAASADCFQSARGIDHLPEELRSVADALPRAMIFFPDLYYPATVQPAPTSTLVADLSKQPKAVLDGAAPEHDSRNVPQSEQDSSEDEAVSVPAAFVYPEWNHKENDYYEDWCLLRELVPTPDPRARFAGEGELAEDADRARRMFERLKPELARKEKYLAHGDEINIDLLVEYMALKRALPAPRVRFYEKPFIKRRDLAVALLLDVSGSTASVPEQVTSDRAGNRIIDLEKRAALGLGEGLDALGDEFAIYGFSGNGRENCNFFIYKDISESYSDESKRRLLAAHPTASTRMGVALRHCHAKLQGHAARKKLIILITDGKPQDSGYDPASRYAQYDVRMACHECAKDGIHVVCLSTLENSRADLEIMFPHRNYVILEDMTRLSDVLPMLYLKITG